MAIIGIDNRLVSNYTAVLKGFRSSGGQFTGFLVSPDIVLSVEHAYKTNDSYKFNINNVEHSATMLYKDKLKDYSILQLNKPVDNVVPLSLSLVNNTILQLGTSVIGFPSDRETQTITYSNNINTLVSFHLKYDHDTYGGSSGSPILNNQDKVIGIHKATTGRYNLGTAITSDIINLVEYYDNLEGPASVYLDNQEVNTIDIKRYLNTKTNSHMYSSNSLTIQHLSNSEDYVEEYTDLNNSNNLNTWSFYNQKTNSTFFTKDYNEVNYIKENIEHLIDVNEFLGIEDNTMYRLYNVETGYHFFTGDSNEAEVLTKLYNYTYEGFV